ncbi:MAG: PQQ-binding-like beta-propeller repeat protein, partial [Halothermotrichaceae bacterium]
MADYNVYFGGQSDNYVHKVDSDGNNVWKYDASKFVYGVAVDSDGYVYVANVEEDGENGVHKLDSSGSLVWAYTGHNEDDTIDSVAVDKDGNVYSGSND